MKPRILSVDDHEDTLSILRVMLGSCGYELATASSVAEGLRLAESGGFDLFLLDFKFADGTGKELCERIREFDRETPILFFSGSHPTQHEGAESCGAQGFVMKPDFKVLRQHIRQAVGGGSVVRPQPPDSSLVRGLTGGVGLR
jgi:CheY-like chemotaxis protein